jgi:NIPSNAP
MDHAKGRITDQQVVLWWSIFACHIAKMPSLSTFSVRLVHSNAFFSTFQLQIFHFMRTCLLLLVLVLGVNTLSAQVAERVFELRIYTCEKGKLNDLHRRFRDHTLRLFAKHGMKNEGYWTPIDNKDEQLYFLLSYPSRAAREASWTAFQSDTAWINARNRSEAQGKIVAKAESIFLKTTDYSPNDLKAAWPRIWELRIYDCPPGKLSHLNDRFRNHTMKLFKSHGMRNIIYWMPTDEAQGASTKLYYFLTHRSPDAARASFGTFVQDQRWKDLVKSSEAKAGGKIIDKITSVYLYPTDYSPLY